MKINRRIKRFHDPYGYRNGQHGSVARFHWLVGTESDRANGDISRMDFTKLVESADAVFVLGTSSIEKIRK